LRLRKLILILICVLALALAAAYFLIPPKIGAATPKVSTPSSDSAFTFVVFGDSRPGNEKMDVLQQIIREVNLLNPKFALHTGDIVFGSNDPNVLEGQYRKFWEVASKLKMPLHIAGGNHEIGGSRANEAEMKRQLGEPQLYYSFTYGNSYFAALDSEIIGQTSKITGAQLAWLTSDLQKNNGKAHKFVFVHRPLFPVDGHIGDSLDEYPADRAKLIAVLKKYKVDAVFSGHEHLYNKSVTNGITEYITGGAGAPIYPSLLGTGSFYHYLVVKVNGKDVKVSVVKPHLAAKR
jgi:3',5'-cyclic AMP phosphodiesterase CpdA